MDGSRTKDVCKSQNNTLLSRLKAQFHAVERRLVAEMSHEARTGRWGGKPQKIMGKT